MSFRDKNCVAETIDEIDMVKTKLGGVKHYEQIGLVNWEVEEAIPASDIIWADLNKERSRSIVSKILISYILPLLISSLGALAIIFCD